MQNLFESIDSTQSLTFAGGGSSASGRESQSLKTASESHNTLSFTIHNHNLTHPPNPLTSFTAAENLNPLTKTETKTKTSENNAAHPQPRTKPTFKTSFAASNPKTKDPPKPLTSFAASNPQTKASGKASKAVGGMMAPSSIMDTLKLLGTKRHRVHDLMFQMLPKGNIHTKPHIGDKGRN
jgi:hypothetical protein